MKFRTLELPFTGGASAGIVRRAVPSLVLLLAVAGAASAARVRTGLDVLEAEKFAPLRGKHVGLITNHTGVDAQGRSALQLLGHAPGVTLVALFSPEHGLVGHADEKVASSREAETGLPVYSLYGDTLRPTDEMLKKIDTLVFDIQDAGVRFYTYTTTMAYCMEEAAKRGISVFVLDRPNPIGGEIVEGPMLDGENHIGCDLHVITMRNWHRNFFYENTGVRWVPPSPNLRTPKGAVLYPGLEILQDAGVSVGRGTQTPFEEFGAPWMDGETVATELNARDLPGLHFAPAQFIPATGLYKALRCSGVTVRVTDRRVVRSMRMGLEVAAILRKLCPNQFDPAKLLSLVGNAETLQKLSAGVPPEAIVQGWSADLETFEKLRRQYFLYDTPKTAAHRAPKRRHHR